MCSSLHFYFLLSVFFCSKSKKYSQYVSTFTWYSCWWNQSLLKLNQKNQIRFTFYGFVLLWNHFTPLHLFLSFLSCSHSNVSGLGDSNRFFLECIFAPLLIGSHTLLHSFTPLFHLFHSPFFSSLADLFRKKRKNSTIFDPLCMSVGCWSEIIPPTVSEREREKRKRSRNENEN